MIAHAFDSLLNRGRRPDTARWPAGSALIETRYGAVRVRDTGGAGPVALMAPDGPNVIEHHREVIDALAPHARVVCFDMPGFGFSRPAATYTHSVAQGAGVVLSVMDRLEIREASLLFSCANGFYAIAAARAAPRRIRHLMLAQMPGLASMPAWVGRNVPLPIRVPVIGQALMRVARKQFADNWYRMAMPRKPQRNEFSTLAKDALAHGACFCLAGVVQGLSRADAAELAGVTTPTTLLWGDSDRSHQHTRAESLLELLPAASIVHAPDCGHFPDLEQPARYAELALATLNACQRPA